MAFFLTIVQSGSTSAVRDSLCAHVCVSASDALLPPRVVDPPVQGLGLISVLSPLHSNPNHARSQALSESVKQVIRTSMDNLLIVLPFRCVSISVKLRKKYKEIVLTTRCRYARS